MDKVLNMSIDGWKVDGSAGRVSDPVNTSIGKITKEDFERYYYADFFDYSTGRNPQVITLARPYTTLSNGSHASISKLSVGWCGDFSGDFDGLNRQKNDVYESAIRGYGAPGVEIGGYFRANATKRSLIRYAQFGALTPLMENGGSNGGEKEHLPWYWDDETVDIYRYFSTLHSELVPYLFSYEVEAHLNGKSIIRAPDKNKSQHKLGEELFVSVINSDKEYKTVYFPAGSRWIDYWDESNVYYGGTVVNNSVPLGRYPIFIRAGAIIPMNVQNNLTGHGNSFSKGKTTLLIYPYGSSNFTFHRPLGDGVENAEVAISVNESRGTITVHGDRSAGYLLRVKSFATPSSISGADSWSYDSAKQYININKTGQDFTLTIQGLRGYSGAQRITVTSPNGGENWQAGAKQVIKWKNSGKPGSYVKIELLKGGVLNKIIISRTINDGSHNWTINSTQTPGTNYKVRVTSLNNSAYSDTSNNNFTISSPATSITVVSPNGGENWVRGTKHTVRWTYSGTPGSRIKIELLKGGIFNRTITSNVSIGSSGSGSYNWTVSSTQALGTNYKVKVASLSNAAYNDTSNNNFTISGINVISPNGGENWVRGTKHSVCWTYNGSPGKYVKVELLKGGVFNRTIISNVSVGNSGSGSYNWTISSTQALGTNYKVKVTSLSNSAYTDTSNNNFTIKS